MKTFTTAILFAAIGLIGGFTTACPERKSIADIAANPGRYQNKEVAIAGVVIDSYGISIPGTRYGSGAYKIDDGTGAIWVIVSDGSVPSKGAEIGVRGIFNTVGSWHGRSMPQAIYEKDRRYRKR